MKEHTPWIQLYNGKAFEPNDPRVEDIDIEVIAKALSQICRFGGHTKRFYSVAEHSVHVTNVLPQDFKLYGLLHDAHEAYSGYGDVCNPMKTSEIKYIENLIDTVIAKKFNLDVRGFYSREVKHADLLMLSTEKTYLLQESSRPWETELPPSLNLHLQNLKGDPEIAKQNFLNLFGTLYGGYR